MLAMSRQRCVNRTKVDGQTNVICPTRALFGSWTVEKATKITFYLNSFILLHEIVDIPLFWVDFCLLQLF
jgi:hypothetical protein